MCDLGQPVTGHRIHSVLSSECNPHESVYRAMQDSPLVQVDDTEHSLTLSTQNRSAINCLSVFVGGVDESSGGGEGEGGSTSREVVTHRMLSGDNCGLLVLWACLVAHGECILQPLLTLSVGKVMNGPPVSFLHRTIPPWVTAQVWRRPQPTPR